jgi:hypothetical protein
VKHPFQLVLQPEFCNNLRKTTDLVLIHAGKYAELVTSGSAVMACRAWPTMQGRMAPAGETPARAFSIQTLRQALEYVIIGYLYKIYRDNPSVDPQSVAT